MYTEEQIKELRIKAEKWDALGKQIDACYEDSDEEFGELDEDGTKEESECDLVTIGELAAIAYGWL